MITSKKTQRNKVLVAIFAHPDDESFGPSGTLHKYTKTHDVYLLCATKGEIGLGSENNKIGQIRANELKESAKIIGIKKVYFLNFKDGSLNNSIYHKLAKKIEQKCKQLNPDIIMTYEPQGVSGHIDHITISMVTSYVFFNKLQNTSTLLQYCLQREIAKRIKDYFIYFPKGYNKKDVDMVVDVSSVWDTKIKAMMAHSSQKEDAKRVLDSRKGLPKEEYFLVVKK